METLLTLPAASVDRFSIIRLPDGRVGAWERKTMTCIIDWGKFGVKVKGDTVVEVLKAPAHLASDFLTGLQGNTQPLTEELKAYEQTDLWIDQVTAAYQAFNERTENGLLAIEFLIHDLERIKAGEIVFI